MSDCAATLKGGRLCVNPLRLSTDFRLRRLGDFLATVDYGWQLLRLSTLAPTLPTIDFRATSDFGDFGDFGRRPCPVWRLLPPLPACHAWTARPPLDCPHYLHKLHRYVACRAHNSRKIVSFAPKRRFYYEGVKLHYKNKTALNWRLKPNKRNMQSCPLPTDELNRSEMRLFCPVCRFPCVGDIESWLQKKNRPESI